MNDLIYAWAKAYHQAGWCVLPAKNKHPVFSWKQYQYNRPTTEQIDEWFQDAPDDAQIALVTGKISNVTVIDIDVHKESCDSKKGGICNCSPEDPEELSIRFGLSVTSITGSGGRHVFCKYENVGNSVGLAHPQLDIRSDGGIIILPPSLHESGKYYEWDDLFPWSKEHLSALLPFPTDLKVLLKNKPKTDWNDIVSGVGEGSRNSSATALAGKLVGAFGREDLHAAWELLNLWNTHRNDPPLSQRELQSTFKSIVNKHYGSHPTDASN